MPCLPAKNSNAAAIVAMASYIPEKVVANDHFSSFLETSDEWIASRTGIRERRFGNEAEFPSSMGAAAARKALALAQLDASQIDLILVATMSGDYPTPSTAMLIQGALGCSAPAMDISAACSGFVFALATAKAYIESGLYRNILVIATEKMSSLLDFSDRTTCVLFGDGASAAVVSRGAAGLQIGPVHLGGDGSLSDLIKIEAGGVRCPASAETVQQRLHYFRMEGRELFKHAVRAAVASAQSVLESAALTVGDLRWMVPHQANKRLMDAIAKGLNMPLENIYSIVSDFGNTSAAGIAIALDQACQRSLVGKGDRILLTAFGGGLAWGSVLLHATNTLPQETNSILQMQ